MDSVLKRNGMKEIFSFDKILKRTAQLGSNKEHDNELCVNYTLLVQKIIDQLYDGIPTSKIDELTAQQCASLITTHPDYGELASRLLISNHQKNTKEKYSDVVLELYDFKDIHGKHTPLINEEVYSIVMENKSKIQEMFDFRRDYELDYFGFKTL